MKRSRKIVSLIFATVVLVVGIMPTMLASATVNSPTTWTENNFLSHGYQMEVLSVTSSKPAFYSTALTSWTMLARNTSANKRDYYAHAANDGFINSEGNRIYSRRITIALDIAAASLYLSQSQYNAPYAVMYDSAVTSSSSSWFGYVAAECTYTQAYAEYYTIGSW